MRSAHLRQADLNLLVVFAALAEERSVSRTAQRLHLSQPATSRALQRLRETFRDELMIRGKDGYELTALGGRLATELQVILPRIDRLLGGATFDPNTEEARLRVGVSDNASHVICPIFSRTILPFARKVSFDFVSWNDEVFDALDRGRLDILLTADDGRLPGGFASELLYMDRFVCVAASESRLKKRLSLEEYLDADHIAVTTLDGRQTIPEQRLAGIGYKRRIAMRVPYFSTAVQSVVGTPFLATVPQRFADISAKGPGLRTVAAPPELGEFKYLMAWHPRVEGEAAHSWLRSTMRQVGKELQVALRR